MENQNRMGKTVKGIVQIPHSDSLQESCMLGTHKLQSPLRKQVSDCREQLVGIATGASASPQRDIEDDR
eukprot:1153829-Amphidinium_carterae.1